MSVYRRGDTWWYKFCFANKLIRESAKTDSKTLAKQAEKQRRRELEEGYNGLSGEDRSRRVLPFKDASSAFLEDYKLRHKEKSYSYAKYCVDHLSGHFGEMLLVEISD